MAETADGVQNQGRRDFLRAVGIGAAGIGATLIENKFGVAGKVVGVLDKLEARAKVNLHEIFYGAAQKEYEMPPERYEVVFHFKGSVVIDAFSDLKLREDPIADTGVINWKNVRYLGDVKFGDNSNIKSITIENPVFVVGNPTNSMNTEGSNKWMVLPALVATADTQKHRMVDTPKWVYINIGENTKDLVHFPTEKPTLSDGYIENGNVVRPKVSVKNP